ncbi:MAG: VanZ family protein [Sphingobacteriales bacterium]|jgi:VanZ family protein|nr:VanZ family protein [Sphingobacteriales bacterium]MBP9140072.1 VanZ family protein [Chitinophagales bacterium]MDA0197845.1 VanZ family protein [Bacteroidota bacterium]MBK6889933.1 VanZ family protein [Sphingobacteriales bacterium]MBK7527543.1 VanZ family protein [Sphingobacteriales bacterium]
MNKLSAAFFRKMAFAWAFIIVIISLLPAEKLPRMPFTLLHPDKIGHLVFYGILTYLVHKGFKLHYMITFIGVVLFGLLMEIFQVSFTNRYFELADLIADAAGAALTLLVLGYKFRAQKN